MHPEDAIRHLTALRAELDENPRLLSIDSSAPIDGWCARVKMILTRSLGSDSDVVARFDGIWFSPGVYYEDQPRSDFYEARQSGAAQAREYIDAAVFELGLLVTPAPVVAVPREYDHGLWAHVGGLVERSDWDHVPAAVATYCEDRIRNWAGLPTMLVGHGLYARAFATDGPLVLGQSPGESDGWKYLAMGLAQAIGNVDRHRVQGRSDVEVYARGVLGLGSLLLNQVRWEHAALISNLEDR